MAIEMPCSRHIVAKTIESIPPLTAMRKVLPLLPPVSECQLSLKRSEKLIKICSADKN
jgi:hypothetical protein